MLMLIIMDAGIKNNNDNFNTSHVNVNQFAMDVKLGDWLFQYISC